MNKFIVIIMSFMALIMLVGCSETVSVTGETAETIIKTPKTRQIEEPKEAGIQGLEEPSDIDIGKREIVQLSPDEAYKMLTEDDDIFLLDVRTQAEYDEDSIAGAVLVPVNEIAERIDEIPRDKKIVLYCRSGKRSMSAAEVLVENGFEQVYNMTGGIISWTEAGLPLE